MGFYLNMIPKRPPEPPPEETLLDSEAVPTIATVVGVGLVIIASLWQWGVLQEFWEYFVG